MKKLFLIIFTLSNFNYSQLFEENFDYSTGVLTTVSSSNWTENPVGSTDIEVTSGSLSYTNYASSGIGNKIVLDGGISRSGASRNFTTQSSSGTTVYCSFLLYVTSTDDMDENTTTGDYFASFKVSASSIYRSYVYVRKGSSSTEYSIGLSKSSSSSLTWHGTELAINSTYLIVVGYSFVSGTNNDVSKFWVNPSLTGSEPTPDISVSSGTDADDISLIQFYQRGNSGDMEIDGVRVATSWEQAPLPVELTSFSASTINNQVILNWQTATEVNNYGFEIERRHSSNNSWKNLGFVDGNGNSNSPKYYSFTDNVESTVGKYLYRLKQIDNDGKFEYSSVVTVNFSAPNKFELTQNYPNPFNPSTVISYSIPEDGFVKLSLFNIIGQKVKVMKEGFQSAGSYSFEFNAEGLNSGLYLYKLESNGYTQVRKMLLQK